MADTDRRERARLAIAAIALRLGLPTELTILSERWNTVARLGDSNVIAKAATLADLARSDPGYWFEQEVRLCQKLASLGGPVQRPFHTAVHVLDGLPITLWCALDGETGSSSGAELVTSLAELHRIGGGLLSDRPWFATITTHFDDILPLLHVRGVVPAETLAAIESRYEKLMDSVSAANLPNGFIHGDAQRKNAIASEQGPIWIDFEECSYGPVAWDLACLTMHRGFDTDRMLDLYAEVSGSDRTRTEDVEMLQRLRDLEAVTWMLAIQEERDSVFQESASELLAEILATDG